MKLKRAISTIGAVFSIIVLAFILAGIIILTSTHGPSVSKVDESNWLAMLGTIIGAVGTIGGIAVAAFSLVSLFQVRRAVHMEFEDQYRNHELQLNRLSSEWATGIKYWTQATMPRTWVMSTIS